MLLLPFIYSDFPRQTLFFVNFMTKRVLRDFW